MSGLAFAGGAVIFALLLDRLRLINWHNTKPAYVSKYLALAMWTLGLFDEAAKGTVELYQIGAVIATLIWLLMSRELWKDGPPEYVKRVHE